MHTHIHTHTHTQTHTHTYTHVRTYRHIIHHYACSYVPSLPSPFILFHCHVIHGHNLNKNMTSEFLILIPMLCLFDSNNCNVNIFFATL